MARVRFLDQVPVGFYDTDGAGGGNPGGPFGSIQYNDAGVFNGNSNLLWNDSTNTLSIIGKINATSLTGSLFGTSSWAISASQAINATQALTASYIQQAVSASYALTSSYSFNSTSASYASSSTSASYAFSSTSASYASSSTSASYASSSTSASYASSSTSASYASSSTSASYAFSSTSASYALNSTSASYASSSTSASYAFSSTSASYASSSTSASYALTASFVQTSQTASYILNAVSASYAATASLAPSYLPLAGGTITGNLTVNGTASITYLNVVYETASVIYSTGSNQFGDAANDIQTLYGTVIIPTGSLTITGSIISTTGFTGSLQGTSSWAISASQASTASYAFNTVSASYASSSTSASYAFSSTSASYASSSTSASYASSSTSASYAISSSYSFNSTSASYASSSTSASYASSSTSASYAFSSTSASYALTSSLPLQGIVTASTSELTQNIITFTKGNGDRFDIVVNNVQSASYASSSTSASYALTSSLPLQGIVTASALDSTIRFTKGNGSTFDVTLSQSGSVDTASYAKYSEFAGTASYATASSDIIVYVKNQSGNNIAKGVVVRITGSNNSSDIPRVTTASYEDDNNSANTLGITQDAITSGGEGYVITEGILLGINTSNFTSGQLIYLGPTGSIIGYAPAAPFHAVRLGEVIREQTNNGSIYVRVDNGYEIEELHDVLVVSASSGDLLRYSGSVWINTKQLTGSYSLTGSLQATSFTGSLQGTSSWAISASQASTASYVFNAVSASYASSSTSASYAFSSTSASYALTSSFAQTASYALNAGPSGDTTSIEAQFWFLI